MGFGEVGFGEAGFGKVGFGEVGFSEVGFGEAGFGEVGFGEVGFGEVGFGEMGENQSMTVSSKWLYFNFCSFSLWFFTVILRLITRITRLVNTSKGTQYFWVSKYYFSLPIDGWMACCSSLCSVMRLVWIFSVDNASKLLWSFFTTMFVYINLLTLLLYNLEIFVSEQKNRCWLNSFWILNWRVFLLIHWRWIPNCLLMLPVLYQVNSCQIQTTMWKETWGLISENFYSTMMTMITVFEIPYALFYYFNFHSLHKFIDKYISNNCLFYCIFTICLSLTEVKILQILISTFSFSCF